MQTILGANGAIGKHLARELRQFTDQIRLVSRHPQAVDPADELFAADLTLRENVFRAVEGSEIVYLTVGFKYDLSVWKKVWPPLIRNVTEACKQHGSKLVMFDNIYMYDRNQLGHMTESTPILPSSEKGKIRAEINSIISSEFGKGSLRALIARSADFYGPGESNSLIREMVFKNLMKGKAAQWLLNADKIHQFTFTPDAAKGTAILGNTPDAYDQVWHLPTDDRRLTGRQWVELFAAQMNVKPRVTVVPRWMLSVIGLFIPVLGEMKEMAYQYDRDYVFDSSKFNRRFSFTPTTPEEAIRQIIAAGL